MDNQKNSPVNPSTNKFMDIQAPQAPSQATANSVPSAPPLQSSDIEAEKPMSDQASFMQSTEAAAPASFPIPSLEVVEAPAADNNPVSGSQLADGVSDGSLADSADNSSNASQPEHPNPMAIPPQPAKKRRPLLITVIALVVAAAIAGLVFFVYNKSHVKTPAPSPAATQPPSQSSGASQAEIDDTTKQVDDSLNKLDDNKDFPASDTSTQSLGI